MLFDKAKEEKPILSKPTSQHGSQIDPCSTKPPQRNCLINHPMIRPKPDFLNDQIDEKPDNHPNMDSSNGRPFIPRPTPYPTKPTGLILPDDNKPSAMELWKPFFDGISDFFETKKKDFIKIMGIMNGENDYPSDMVVKPPFATGKLPQNGIRGSSSIQV